MPTPTPPSAVAPWTTSVGTAVSAFHAHTRAKTSQTLTFTGQSAVHHPCLVWSRKHMGPTMRAATLLGGAQSRLIELCTMGSRCWLRGQWTAPVGNRMDWARLGRTSASVGGQLQHLHIVASWTLMSATSRCPRLGVVPTIVAGRLWAQLAAPEPTGRGIHT